MDEKLYKIKFELLHKVDLLTPTIYLELNLLELMKIYKSLNYIHSNILAKKIKRYLVKIVKQYDDEIDFKKKLPLKCYEDE